MFRRVPQSTISFSGGNGTCPADRSRAGGNFTNQARQPVLYARKGKAERAGTIVDEVARQRTNQGGHILVGAVGRDLHLATRDPLNPMEKGREIENAVRARVQRFPERTLTQPQEKPRSLIGLDEAHLGQGVPGYDRPPLSHVVDVELEAPGVVVAPEDRRKPRGSDGKRRLLEQDPLRQSLSVRVVERRAATGLQRQGTRIEVILTQRSVLGVDRLGRRMDKSADPSRKGGTGVASVIRGERHLIEHHVPCAPGHGLDEGAGRLPVDEDAVDVPAKDAWSSTAARHGDACTFVQEQLDQTLSEVLRSANDEGAVNHPTHSFGRWRRRRSWPPGRAHSTGRPM